MLHTLRCIRFGEVLMDENQNLVLLCMNCHTDYTTLSGFQAHLRHCNGIEALAARNANIKYLDLSERKLGKNRNGLVKQFLIHNISGVVVGNLADVTDNNMCPLDLDAELMDPRWYTDLGRTSPEETSAAHLNNKSCRFNEQVQFKENVKTSDCQNSKARRNLNLQKGDVKLKATNVKASPTNKARKLSTTQNVQKKQNSVETSGSKPILLNKLINRQPYNISTRGRVAKNVINGLTSTISVETSSETLVTAPLKRSVVNDAPVVPISLKRAAPIANAAPPLKPVVDATALIAAKPKLMRLNQNNIPTSDSFYPASTTTPTNTKQTEQILNKLQNLGLQIKRTSSAQNSSPDLAIVKDSKTMELMKKLQMKGIKCSVVSKKGAAAAKKPNL